MEQHAIPQQISSYEFKLIGDMTLKQFLKAAVGIVIAVMINATGLIFFLKYPLMLIFGAGGLLIAFVPFQDRPLETWLVAFLRSIYSPTIYTYKKMPDKDWINLMSKSSASEKTEEKEAEVEAPVKDRDRVKEFIESLPSVKAGKEEETQNSKLKTQKLDEGRQVIGKIGVTDGVNKLPAREETVTEEDWRTTKAGLGLKKTSLEATGKAEFGEIPMPNRPDTPNVLVGMVTEMNGKIIDGAIIEIQDERGNPSRVLKTNSLGQFKTTAPLANGKYLVITEKESFKFDRVDILLEGKTVEPIKIKSII
jgi:hypothetical protein